MKTWTTVETQTELAERYRRDGRRYVASGRSINAVSAP
jgi:hypothetical protein